MCDELGCQALFVERMADEVGYHHADMCFRSGQTGVDALLDSLLVVIMRTSSDVYTYLYDKILGSIEY